MLFVIKNKALPSLILAVILSLLALLLIKVLGLGVSMEPYPQILRDIVLGLGAIVASDVGFGILFVVILRTYFVRRYKYFIEYFEGQSVWAILSGGVLAGAEELIFRGVILTGLITIGGLDVPLAVLISAVLFAIAHIIPGRFDWLFTVWAIWEGIILGAIYIYTGSLPVVVIVHMLHDIFGFALFSLQRKRGLLIFINLPDV